MWKFRALICISMFSLVVCEKNLVCREVDSDPGVHGPPFTKWVGPPGKQGPRGPKGDKGEPGSDTEKILKQLNYIIEEKFKDLERKLDAKYGEQRTTALPVTTTTTTTTRVSLSCDNKYHGKCFRMVLQKDMTYKQAQDSCERDGGVVGNVYGEDHLHMIRQMVGKEAEIAFFFFVGMTYNYKTGKVLYRDGSVVEYEVKWLSHKYPMEHSLLRYIFLPDRKGFFNHMSKADANAMGALCEYKN